MQCTNSSPNDCQTFAEPRSGSANTLAQELRSSKPPNSRAQPQQASCLPDLQINLRLHSNVIIGLAPVLPSLAPYLPYILLAYLPHLQLATSPTPYTPSVLHVHPLRPPHAPVLIYCR